MTTTTTTTNPRYFIESLVTDWIAWEVVRSTPKTVTLRRMAKGDMVRDNPERTVWEAVPSIGDAEMITLRLRKDGTYRHPRNRKAMHPTEEPTESRYWLD